MQGCCLTGAQLPVAPTISSHATKILNKEPAWVPKNYDSSDNSLCAHFQWRNDRIPACSFGTFETKMFVNIDCRQKIYMLLKVNKQALYWKFKTQTNQVSRQVNGVLSIYLLYLLTFSISGLLEMWLCLLTLYFRSQKSSQKIFLDRAALIRRLPVNGLKQWLW